MVRLETMKILTKANYLENIYIPVWLDQKPGTRYIENLKAHLFTFQYGQIRNTQV